MSEKTVSKHNKELRAAVSDSGPLYDTAGVKADLCIYGERK